MNGNINQLNGNAAFHTRCLAYVQNNPGMTYAGAASRLVAKDAKAKRVTESVRKAAAGK